jgi:mono/diheme cytochrome c family protein
VLADAGSSGTVGPNLDEKKPDLALAIERITNGASPMPAFKDTLTEQQIVDVATYVVEASGGGS